MKVKKLYLACHNPYFSRWFSAIAYFTFDKNHQYVTILILVDGFLQYNIVRQELANSVTILILVDGFLQYDKKALLSLIDEMSQSLF